MIKNKILIIGLFGLIQFNPALGSSWFRSLYNPKPFAMERLSVSLTGGVLGVGAGVILAPGAVPVLAFAVLGSLVGNQWYSNKYDDKKHAESEQKQQELLNLLHRRRQEISDNSTLIKDATRGLGLARQVNTETQASQAETRRFLDLTGERVAETVSNNSETRELLLAIKNSIKVTESHVGVANDKVGSLGRQLEAFDVLQLSHYQELNLQLQQVRKELAEERIRQRAAGAEQDRQIGEIHAIIDESIGAFELTLRKIGVDPRVVYGMGGLKRGLRVPSVLGPVDNAKSASVMRTLLFSTQVKGEHPNIFGGRINYLEDRSGASGAGASGEELK